MTPAEVEALKVTGPEGGLQGALIHAPNGKTYAFSLRPLLPDEQE